jgi:hypothetical protein
VARTIGHIRSAAARRVSRALFGPLQRAGLHVTPVDFYQPVPDTRTLGAATWSRDSELVGVPIDGTRQLAFLERLRAAVGEEWAAIRRRPAPAPGEPRFALENPMFGPVDAEIYYGLLRVERPRRVFEIGAGNSTLLAAEALLCNAAEDGGPPAELVAFEPHPNPVLRAGFPGLTRLVRRRVQDVPLGELTRLEDGDVLFIDSSHVLSIGSDVRFEILEILPRLRPGVWVHFHDIFLPAEYPRDWVLGEHRFWNEQYVVQAFLAFNGAWDIVWAASWMARHHGAEVAAAIPSFEPGVTRPGSLWLRRVGRGL